MASFVESATLLLHDKSSANIKKVNQNLRSFSRQRRSWII